MPLLTLNLAGLALAALWLGVQSQWQVVWLGFVMLIFSPYIIPTLLIPAGIFSHFIGVYNAQQQPDKERMMFILSLSYIILFMTFWCVGVFEYVTHSVQPKALLAGLLWASTAALEPLLWWSSRDRSNIFIMTMVEAAQLAILALAAIRLMTGASSFWLSFAEFGAIMAVVAAGQAIYEDKFMNKTKVEPR